MHISHLWTLVSIAILVSGICCDWEVHNDDSAPDTDDLILQDEYLLPVYSTSGKHARKPSQKTLSSLNQNVKKSESQGSYITTHLHHRSDSKDGVNLMVSRTSSSQGAPPIQLSPLKEADHLTKPDSIDLASEGFLDVADKVQRSSASGRKLAGFSEAAEEHDSNTQIMSQSNPQGHPQLQMDHSSQAESPSLPSQDMIALTLEKVCIDENSEDCLMFQKDLEAMLNDANLSHLALAVHQRQKRQASSNSERIQKYNENLTDCEGGNCFSGDDQINSTDTNEDMVRAPVFTINSVTTFRTNRTTLSNADKEKIARDWLNQVKGAFSNMPGFKDMTVDKDNMRIENGTLVIPWSVGLSGDSSEFTGKNAKQIGDTVSAALKNAGDSIKTGVAIEGQPPINDFNVTDAVAQVVNQANDPCRTNPCDELVGYGHCQAISTTKVVCHHNCNALRTPCQNGTCQLDSQGTALCQCTSDYSGTYCDKKLTLSNHLDTGKIIGATVGSALILCGLVGLCCILAGWRRGNKLTMSHYTDEEGSGRSSNPSSNICVLDRPTVSIAPLPIYHGTRGAFGTSGDFSRESSYANGSDGSNYNPFSTA